MTGIRSIPPPSRQRPRSRRPRSILRLLMSLCCLALQFPESASYGAASSSDRQRHRRTTRRRRSGQMTLSQFQSTLQTYVDDEMAYVVEESSRAVVEEEADEGDPPRRPSGGAGAELLDLALKSHAADVDGLPEIEAEGQHLDQHHHGRALRHQLRRREQRERRRSLSGDEKQRRERGRYSSEDDPPPAEVESAWEGIVAHAWDVARLFSSSASSNAPPSSRKRDAEEEGIESGRGRRIEEEKQDGAPRSLASNDSFVIPDSDMDDRIVQNEIDGDLVHKAVDDGDYAALSSDWSRGISLDEEEEETATPWSDEGHSLFLTCHDSSRPMSGNEHLEAILARAGRASVAAGDVGNAGGAAGGSYLSVVTSSPRLVCVVLGMQPAYAEAIADGDAKEDDDDDDDDDEEEEGSTPDSSFMTIVPWVDVMKISPELFAHVSSSSSTASNDDPREDEKDGAPSARGLRNFRRRMTPEGAERNLTWRGDERETDGMSENNNVVFSLAPPFDTMGHARSVVGDLIAMAKNGRRERRRRRTAEDDRPEDDAREGDDDLRRGRRWRRRLSIRDALSVAGSGGDDPASKRRRDRWSRILAGGLESPDERRSCASVLEGLELEPSFRSSFEFPLIGTTSSSSSHPAVDPECVASIVAGLSVHPHVVNVGLVPRTVQLDNVNAQWLVQGRANDDGERRRPFFDAGLDGSGQVVSVSDTGLDVDNCYFKDARGDGSSFEGWDYSRRKVVRYDVSERGGDRTDTQRGHGTHVVGTVAGRHALDETSGDGDDPKEGIAPGAKVHFYDIGDGHVVNDPREGWFESFHQNHPRGGAKVASGSWGFGYRESYDWVCQLYDQLMIDHPDVLYVASAGNTGNKFDSPFRTVGAPASCKNVLAVGATSSVGFGPGLHHVVDFSSRGPTSDGRTKPDVLAPGYALDSALSGSHDCKIKEAGYLKAGTSMSAPAIAGVAAQVRQYFQEGFYPCGERGCGEDVDPSGTLVKAVIANGAQFTRGVQLGGTATVIEDQPVRPYDDTQNMGEANLLVSLPLRGENDFNVFVQNDAPLSSKKSWYVDSDLEGCDSDLTATLAWYDPPGANGCTKCLMNDLDLHIESLSSSKRYYPNGKSEPDTLNNIERVRIAKRRNFPGERFKVTVKASMLGPGYSAQKFSLVVTGCFTSANEEPPPVDPFLSSKNYELASTYKANRKQAGNMFGVKAKEDGVAVTAFAIHTVVSGKNVKLRVYTLDSKGGITGDEAFLGDPSKWTMISPPAGIEVPAMGFGSPTVIPRDSFAPVSIGKGTTQTFYITFADEAEMLYFSVDDTHPTGAVYASDGNIEIMTGVGKGVNFGTNWQSRQMNGAVFYSVSGDSPDASPSTSNSTPKPTGEPTRRPSNGPTLRPTKRPVVQPPSFPILPLFIELTTTYKANKKQAGNMFDVLAKKDVAISSFKIHTLLKGPVPATIYTRLGSWQNYDKDPSAWEKVATVDVNCKGYGTPTIISIASPIWVESGSTRAFYLTFDEPELLYHYSDEYPSGSVYAEDSAMQIMTGVGKAAHFGTATYLSRQLNGALVYYIS